MTASNPFDGVIDHYTLEQALEDGMLVKVGEFALDHMLIIFTSNLLADVKGFNNQLSDKYLIRKNSTWIFLVFLSHGADG